MSASDEERNSRPQPDGPAAIRIPAPHIPGPRRRQARCRRSSPAPSYRKADEDIHFLTSAEARGPRLELEYLKAELLLRRHGVTDTIVVFGSTRIVEPALAEQPPRRSAGARAAQSRRRGRARRLAAAPSASSRKFALLRMRASSARLVGAACAGGDWPRARDRHRRRTGHHGGGEPRRLRRRRREPSASTSPSRTSSCRTRYVTPGLCFHFHYFALRKMHFLLRARALVAFPGRLRHARRIVRDADAGRRPARSSRSRSFSSAKAIGDAPLTSTSWSTRASSLHRTAIFSATPKPPLTFGKKSGAGANARRISYLNEGLRLCRRLALPDPSAQPRAIVKPMPRLISASAAQSARFFKKGDYHELA